MSKIDKILIMLDSKDLKTQNLAITILLQNNNIFKQFHSGLKILEDNNINEKVLSNIICYLKHIDKNHNKFAELILLNFSVETLWLIIKYIKNENKKLYFTNL